MKKKIIRITTVPISLAVLLKGQLKYMSEHYEVIGVSSKDKFLKVVENQEGIKTHGINMTRSISPLKDLKAAFILYKYLKKEKPSIVHTHTPKAGTLGMLAALFAGVPHRLHTIAGLPLLEATGAKRKLLNFVEKITYSCATLILPNSFAMRDIILKEKFCSTKKLKVIANGSSNGIDVDHYKVDNVSTKEKNDLIKKFSIKAQDTVFIFIGRIVKDKGINELITAFNEISKTNDNVKLIIVGPSEKELDPIDPNTEELIANHNNIYTTGLVEDIRPYVAISDVLTFPSYREGFPNVVLQANCMGIPCIVSDINGCNEIITHGHNGLIIPPKNSKALKTAMLDIINSPNLVNTLAQNSRQNIVNKYRREFIWEELLTLYNNLNDEKTI
ncbi:glycosyltransferase family 4 protein [uncultured Winogradskyella sp.]|mgnify:FL=1|uniref:glycosyltransferase family 4 protein n=3 Tax=uncultured Winogradskyella sp. TaxID=395353 RepID=UPI0026135106|nr:glycosyltransferase family 4 protein [uncultured Winogradskyella sp.]|tara:strand:+ start:1858 stop:3021 length:1164 start_codon:yes stop_codon:yes gene_type:complete